MTDKQIIINKMDKSKRYCEGIDCAWCNEKEPCIYKIANELEEKLLRKTQECNKLYIQLKTDEEYYKEEENTLRKIIKNKEERNIELYKENNKLKQTLAEIKDVAEANIRIADLEGLNGVYRRGLAKQILQKVAEV